MIAKTCLLAFAGLPVLVSAAPQAVFTTHPYIHQMVCDEGRGTAFQINGNTALSVDHVSRMTDCRINGIPAFVIENDRVGDFSVIRFRFNRPGGLRLSCEAFRHGETYSAIGYAHGERRQRVLNVVHWSPLPKVPFRGWQTLSSPVRFIPGMSGGPVFSMRGEVVGTVNAYSPIFPLSFSRSLSDTSLCARAHV